MAEKREIPLGKSKEIETLKNPAVEIKNKVLFVNDAFELPFKIKEGKETKLGLFLKSFPSFKIPSAGERALAIDKLLEIQSSHRRSALLGRVVFKDKDGNFWRDIDIKGLGNFGAPVRIRPEDKDEAEGILKLGSAYHDKEMSEAFLEKGIRTHRVISIIGIYEILDENNEKISIETAKERGLMPEPVKPVLEIRAFGVKSRITDFIKIGTPMSLVDDARILVAQEFGKNKEKFIVKDYLSWFAKTLGEQVARIHKNGWYHGYLTPHNITLDCRIVDLDSVGWIDKIRRKKGDRIAEEFVNQDRVESIEAIRWLVKAIFNAADSEENRLLFGELKIMEIFEQSYKEEYNKK